MSLSVPTVDDLKEQINTTGSVDDVELGNYLDAAIGVVENVVGPISPTTATETHYGLSSDVLVLRQAPVVELVSVTGRTFPGADLVSGPLTDYVLDGPTGIVRLASGYRFVGDLTVTYTAGLADGSVPADVWLATLIIGAHLWETQRVPGVRPGMGDMSPTTPIGFALPNRAIELLAPYRQMRVA